MKCVKDKHKEENKNYSWSRLSEITIVYVIAYFLSEYFVHKVCIHAWGQTGLYTASLTYYILRISVYHEILFENVIFSSNILFSCMAVPQYLLLLLNIWLFSNFWKNCHNGLPHTWIFVYLISSLDWIPTCQAIEPKDLVICWGIDTYS